MRAACDCSTPKGLTGGPADICLPNCVSDEVVCLSSVCPLVTVWTGLPLRSVWRILLRTIEPDVAELDTDGTETTWPESNDFGRVPNAYTYSHLGGVWGGPEPESCTIHPNPLNKPLRLRI